MFLGCFTQYILCLTTEQKHARLFYTMSNMFLGCFTQYILCLTTHATFCSVVKHSIYCVKQPKNMQPFTQLSNIVYIV